MNTSPDFTSKLSKEQRMFVFRMHAEGYSLQEIVNEIKLKFDITISKEAIRQTCSVESNQPFIKHFKDLYLAKVKEVPIANKRIRVDDLERIRLKLIRVLDEADVKTKAGKTTFLAAVRRLNETLSTAREEMENKPNLVAGVVIGDLNELSDDELHSRKRDLIAKALKSIGGGVNRPDESTEGISDPGEEQPG